MNTYLKQFGSDIHNNKLTMKLGMTFAPSRPVCTFNNRKVLSKAKWHAEFTDANGKGKELAMIRAVERAAEVSRGELLQNYRDNRKEFKKNVQETKDWEATVMEELSMREKKMARSERTEFANVLVCKSLEGGDD